MKTILYILREDIREPLVRSQVVAYLSLMKSRYRFVIVNLSKKKYDGVVIPGDVARLVSDGNARLVAGRFCGFGGAIAGALNMISLFVVCLYVCVTERISLVHSRSYIPSMVALVLSTIFRVPFVFDMRGAWPEELVATGRLKRRSLAFRCLRSIERCLFSKAAAVVSLTEVAARHYRRRYQFELVRTPMVVVPTCVDLDRFAGMSSIESRGVVGSMGTVLSGWFRVDMLDLFFQALARRSSCSFEVVTNDASADVREALPLTAKCASLQVFSVAFEAVGGVISRFDAGVMFFRDDGSKIGSAPTRFAEFLACGVPVVVNAGIGDLADIVYEHRVGVVVSGDDDASMVAAVEALQELLCDLDLSRRCRQLAHDIFSVESGAGEYLSVYDSLI